MDKSRSDLRAIDALLGVNPPIMDLACYHATQAAEKALKGLIAAYGQPPQKTHDLLRLADLVPVVVPEAVLRWCEEILPYSWSTRYPTDADVTETQAIRAREAAIGIVRWVEAQLEAP